MKLKYFTAQTKPRAWGGAGKDAIAKVSFGSNGQVSFNALAGDLIGLKPGIKISMAQDEKDPENWYFFLDKEHGFEVRLQKEKYWIFQHSGLVREFKAAKELDPDKTVKGMIAGQPTVIPGDKAGTKYWGILIRATV